MKRTMKRAACFLSIIVIAVIIMGLIGIMVLAGTRYDYYTTYCKDYYAVLANTKSCNYNQIIEANEEADKITREKYTEYGDYFIYHEYDDGRLFVFSENENAVGTVTLRRMELTGPDYRFGGKDIGVGTDKSTIEKAYRNSYRGLQQDGFGNYFVEDGNFEVFFSFDENEAVDKIVVGRAEIMHGTHGWKEVKARTD